MQHASVIIQMRVGLGDTPRGTVTYKVQKAHNCHYQTFHTSIGGEVVNFDGAAEEDLTGVIGQNAGYGTSIERDTS